jgi:hypothetical protein
MLIAQPLQTIEETPAIHQQVYVMLAVVELLALKITLARSQSAAVRLANVPIILNVLLIMVHVIPMNANRAQPLTAVHA